MNSRDFYTLSLSLSFSLCDFFPLYLHHFRRKALWKSVNRVRSSPPSAPSPPPPPPPPTLRVHRLNLLFHMEIRDSDTISRSCDKNLLARRRARSWWNFFYIYRALSRARCRDSFPLSLSVLRSTSLVSFEARLKEPPAGGGAETAMHQKLNGRAACHSVGGFSRRSVSVRRKRSRACERKLNSPRRGSAAKWKASKIITTVECNFAEKEGRIVEETRRPRLRGRGNYYIFILRCISIWCTYSLNT